MGDARLCLWSRIRNAEAGSTIADGRHPMAAECGTACRKQPPGGVAHHGLVPVAALATELEAAGRVAGEAQRGFPGAVGVLALLHTRTFQICMRK